mgnify:CR=1 FL=1
MDIIKIFNRKMIIQIKVLMIMIRIKYTYLIEELLIRIMKIIQ